MAELVSLKTVDGLSRVINLNHVVHIQDIAPNNNECTIYLSNGDRLVTAMSASQVTQLPRLTGGTARSP
jgi:hypothetical protein